MTLVPKKCVRLNIARSIMLIALVDGLTGCAESDFLGGAGRFGNLRDKSKRGMTASGEQNCTPPSSSPASKTGGSAAPSSGWSTIAPTLKSHLHQWSSVWTGTHLILWGGGLRDGTNIIRTSNFGEMYDSSSDSWKALSTTGAPSERSAHSAVWAGSKMIVWGGARITQVNPEGFAAAGSYLNDGAIYDPCTDTWSSMSSTNAPQARGNHIAVWTGSKMIVWGGTTGFGNFFSDTNTGSIYDPATDTWANISTSNAPSPRLGPNTAWTGTELLVWGGCRLYSIFPVDCKTDGALYNPETNSWRAMSPANGLTVREGKNSVWTGSELIVWGGWYNRQMTSGVADSTATNTHYNTGFRYNPSTDTWTEMSTANAPSPRTWTTLSWTGSKMIAWGGIEKMDGKNESFKNGSIYDPSANSWTPMNSTSGPTSFNSSPEYPVGTWNGQSMLLWKSAMKYTP